MRLRKYTQFGIKPTEVQKLSDLPNLFGRLRDLRIKPLTAYPG